MSNPRNYYTIDLPTQPEDNAQRRFILAVMYAGEMAKNRPLPCGWRKVWDDGTQVRICRTCLKSGKGAGK